MWVGWGDAKYHMWGPSRAQVLRPHLYPPDFVVVTNVGFPPNLLCFL